MSENSGAVGSRRPGRLSRRAFGMGALALAAAPFAARAAQEDFAALATDGGPAGRTERLLARARAEGALTIYGSAPVEDMSPVFAAFEKAHGIRLRYWRAGPQEVIRRTLSEYRAGRYEVDLIQANGPTLERLRREHVLQKVLSPVQADLMAEAVPEHREWVGERLNIIIGAINTRAVPKDRVPSSYEEFTDPFWKGKIAVEATDFDWFATVVKAMGEERGLALFREIATLNGLSVRRGHTLLTTLVAAGEAPASLNVFTYKVQQFVARGEAIAPLHIPPAVGRVNGIAALRHPSHPNAALLYYDFMLGDAQRILMTRNFTPTNRKIAPLPEGLQVKLVDSALMVDEGKKWTRLWKEITTLRPSN